MEKKHAFLLSLTLTIIIASNIFLFTKIDNQQKQTTLIGRVIDGDTIETTQGETIRLNNINTPEKNHPNAGLSVDILQGYINKTILIETHGVDKYQRTLATLYDDELNINLKLVGDGFANKYLVEKSQLKIFAEAEEKAIMEEKGIWQRSPHANCIQTDIKSKEEIVILNNNCSELNLENWIITHEGRKEYKLPQTSSSVINIHSTNGTDNETDIFWNLEEPVWNNKRDTLYLFDNSALFVHHNSYGY